MQLQCLSDGYDCVSVWTARALYQMAGDQANWDVEAAKIG